MNYLFHLYLSGDDPELLVGNFMGDFVKGPLGDRYPPRLRRGIDLHRRIDSFARDEIHFNRSRLRIDPRFGLYRGILVDLFYDHFLAASWEDWSEEPLFDYLHRVRLVVEGRKSLLPERLQELLPVIFEDLLLSYREAAGVGRALERMGRRVRRSNPLPEGGGELVRHYDDLRRDFLAFRSAALLFSSDLVSDPEVV